MKTYARIENNKVAELFSTNLNIADLFHPDLVWIDIGIFVNVQVGWGYVNGGFVQPILTAAGLAQLRSQVSDTIKLKRDFISDNGGYSVIVNGVNKWFHSDPKSKVQQLGLFIMGASVPAIQWKTMDGSFVTMTQTLAGQIFQAAAAQDTTIFQVAETHINNVMISTDPLSYDFSTGWPATFLG